MNFRTFLFFLLGTAAWLAWSGCTFFIFPRNPPTGDPPEIGGFNNATQPSDICYVTKSLFQGRTLAQIEVDDAEARDLKQWGRHAADICAEWYPKIAEQLGLAEGLTNRTILIYLHDPTDVANTDPRTGVICFSPAYLRKVPNDWGLVVHELVHTLQAYDRRGAVPGNAATNSFHQKSRWLSEGIADYVRYAFYEPETPPPRINPDTAKYTDSYHTTATFLRWIAKTYDPELIKHLNLALRDGTYTEDSFMQFTGKSLEELWAEFVAGLRAGWKSSKR